MKYKEKYEEKKEKELKQTNDPQSKLKAYEKKKKMYKSFCISKPKDN